MTSQLRKRLARIIAWVIVTLVLFIWVYHVLIGGADPLLAAIWTAFFLVDAIIVAVAVGLYYERRRSNRR